MSDNIVIKLVLLGSMISALLCGILTGCVQPNPCVNTCELQPGIYVIIK